MKYKYKFCLLYLLSFFTYFNMKAQTQLTISGGHVVVNGDIDIVLENTSWLNNADFSAGNGSVHITGDALMTDAQIGGTNSTTFNNLIINKSANAAELSVNTIVTSQLNLQNGFLNLSDFDLNLGVTGFPVISGNNYISTSGTGMLQRTINGGALKSFPVGIDSQTPMTITNNGETDDFRIRVGDQVLQEGTSGDAFTEMTVDHTWFVEKDIPTDCNIELTATWNAADELTGFDRTAAYLSHYTEGNWDLPATSAATGSNPYTINRTGITSLSPFAVASGTVLPVELLLFTAKKQGRNALLNWSTISEINVARFEIEHGTDGFNFFRLGATTAAGNTQIQQNYDYLHFNPALGLNYYRLKQIDHDGSFVYSPLRLVEFSESKNTTIKMYPNPTSDILYIDITDLLDFQIRIYDVNGRMVTHLENISQINLNTWTPGTYIVEVFDDLDKSIHLEKINVSH